MTLKKKFLNWIASFLLEDTIFISRLYDRIEAQRKFRAELLELARKAKLDKQQIKDAEYKVARMRERQSRCSHLKGGSVRGPNVDYAIWDHTFPDGRRTVQCLVCAREWSGKELESDEVLKMINCTTNTKTSSEVPLKVTPKRESTAVFYSPVHYKLFNDRSEHEEDERKNNPLWPFMPRGYVKYWDKMLKKLRNKKVKKNANNDTTTTQ